jgi:hypothetical protein
VGDPAADPKALKAAGMRALGAGDVAAARDLLRRALDADPSDLPGWLNLGGACRAMGDVDGALQAVAGALKLDARNFMALLMRASLLERQGEAREAAVAYSVALTQAPPDARLDASTLRAVQHARTVTAAYRADLEAFVRERTTDTLTNLDAGGAARTQAFIDSRLGRRRRFEQKPAEFFYPGLPAIEFYDRAEFPFLADLEAATDDIRAELRAILESDAGSTPYIKYPDGLPIDQWAELNHNPRWSAYHLLELGEVVGENADRCPKTMGAIARLPQPQLAGRSPAAMFSVLRPHTRIPPHTGVTNTRLVLHLPLIVPPGCGFRVGNETREWQVGEAWVFDDTLEHEAWNDSDQVRVILICDVWTPRIPAAERPAVVAVMTAMDAFHGTVPEAGL